MIKKFALALTAAGALSMPMVGCTQTEQAVAGAIGGGIAGCLIGDSLEGCLIGAAAGAAAGTVIHRVNNGRTCYYANGRGGYYKGTC